MMYIYVLNGHQFDLKDDSMPQLLWLLAQKRSETKSSWANGQPFDRQWISLAVALQAKMMSIQFVTPLIQIDTYGLTDYFYLTTTPS